MTRLLAVVMLLTVVSCKEDPGLSAPPAPALPEITSVVPTSGRTGSYVTLTGTGIDNNTAVKFGSEFATVISHTETSIVVAVPAAFVSTVDVHVVFNNNSFDNRRDVEVFKKFSILNDTWTSKGNLPGGLGARSNAVWFAIGSKIYYGLGASFDNTNVKWLSAFDLWEYASETGTWTRKKDFQGITGTFGDVYSLSQEAVFVIENKAYVVLGNGSVWQYDPASDTWTAKETFQEFRYRRATVSFTIGNKGYLGTGVSDPWAFRDFWEYNATTDKWTAKADFPGTERYYSIGFAVAGKGYLGGGAAPGSNNKGDFYEYDPSLNTWTRKPDCPLIQLYAYRAGFHAGNFGVGGDGALHFYKYDPSNSLWVQLENVPNDVGDYYWGATAGGKTLVRTERKYWEMKVE